jgi:hypothetical protein
VEPILLVTEQAAEKLAPQLRSRRHIRVIVCGDGRFVNLWAAMSVLRRQFDIQYLLFEGGPALYASMLDFDLVDEKFLTVSPIEVGLQTPSALPGDVSDCGSGESATPSRIRPTATADIGLSKADAVRWKWLSCRRVDDHQFHRFRRRREKP